MTFFAARAACALALALFTGCEPGGDVRGRAEESSRATAAQAEEQAAAAERVLPREMARIDARMAAVDSLFQPLPLLRLAQEEALRRQSYRDQLAQARALGVERDAPPERIETLRHTGRLVPLGESAFWVVRKLDYSQPLVVPGLRELLTEIGARFHARLAELSLPPYRMEISSALRTAEDQAALRQVNPNAVGGESTHEYGAAVDVLYSAYSAPPDPVVAIEAGGATWAKPYLRRYAEAQAERVAGRRALEIKAILGGILLEVQREGLVMVTLERRQPVFHLTLAR